MTFTFIILHGETADSLQNQVSENSENQELVEGSTDSSKEDVFWDENGDGIADDRTFRERMRTWRRARTMSERIQIPGSGNSENTGKFGNKAKQGGQEGNNGNNQGNGNG